MFSFAGHTAPASAILACFASCSCQFTITGNLLWRKLPWAVSLSHLFTGQSSSVLLKSLQKMWLFHQEFSPSFSALGMYLPHEIKLSQVWGKFTHFEQFCCCTCMSIIWLSMIEDRMAAPNATEVSGSMVALEGCTPVTKDKISRTAGFLGMNLAAKKAKALFTGKKWKMSTLKFF